jgi:predicted alpha/beta hydrolase
MVIAPAMATPKRFYRHFARWFARRGYAVVTFDYRGFGDSRHHPVRESDATIEDWANLDLPSVLNWINDRNSFPERIVLLGHSIGGQIVGMMGNYAPLDLLVTFSAQTGYWRLQAPGERIKSWVFMYLLGPALTRTLGYFPWGTLMGGYDLPPSVARQWMRWCRHPQYLFADESLKNLEGYRNFSTPILAYSFEDDPWGWDRAVDWMMEKYTRAPLQRVHVDPEQDGWEPIGHFGFFDEGRTSLWKKLHERFENQLRHNESANDQD